MYKNTKDQIFKIIKDEGLTNEDFGFIPEAEVWILQNHKDFSNYT
jgi:hypothetical protein